VITARGATWTTSMNQVMAAQRAAAWAVSVRQTMNLKT